MLRCSFFLTAALFFRAVSAVSAQVPPPPASTSGIDVQKQSFPPNLVQHGAEVFVQNCSFCHGRDAAGGETGPDLTRSKLVADDVNGNQIGPLIHNGRPDKGMPAFTLPDTDIAAVVAFVHTQKAKFETQKGGRKGVDVSDLQTGNAAAGKAYFDGAGKCSTCHSPTGDLAGVAKRYEGLRLEQRFLYPKGVKSKVTVHLPSGQTISGNVAYQDEFTVALLDASGKYHSWPAKSIQFTVDDPVAAHAELLTKYTDDDIHNLMAYLQTLK